MGLIWSVLWQKPQPSAGMYLSRELVERIVEHADTEWRNFRLVGLNMFLAS